MRALVSSREMMELDHRTSRELGVPARVLMEVAGRAVADVAAQELPWASKIVVACGGGNNGGDGFIAARALAARGHVVDVFLVAERDRIKGDALSALSALEVEGTATMHIVQDVRGLQELAQALAASDMVVDALLGVGVRDEVRGMIGEAIDAINAHARAVVSVDLPSGIDADTGAARGRAVRATHTVTFGFAKRGHYLFPGADLRGELKVVDIGIPRRWAKDVGVALHVMTPEDGPHLVRPRDTASHKGSFGHVLVLAGSPATPGAAVLCMTGALKAGPGLVSWATDEATVRNAPPRPPEVMLRLREEPDVDAWMESLLGGITAVVAGPGLGKDPESVALLRALLTHAKVPICLDADALNIVAADGNLWPLLRPDIVLTPHPKEMSRLCGASVNEVQADRFAAATRLAVSRHCIVALKGAGTVVADTDGTATVVMAGNAGLASGGTGDVLAGLIGGLLAQRLDPYTAVQAGVLLHGVAADVAAETRGMTGMCASDVLAATGQVWRQWQR